MSTANLFRNLFPTLLSLLFLLLLSACSDSSDSNKGSSETDASFQGEWSVHDCPMAIPDGLVQSDFECGTFVVPVNWENPDGERLSFEVAVLKSRNNESKPDPLVFIGGGPGAWNLEGYLPTHAVSVLGPINQDREIIFIDQRGNGLSDPGLYCPEYDEVSKQRFGLVLENSEDAEAFYPGIQSCYQRLSGEGIELSSFNSYQFASDIQALMRALAYQSYNLYGISYGGHRVQIIMRDHPEGIRSAILDSSVIPEIDSTVNRGANFERSLNLLFDACQASDTCNSANPDLKFTLKNLVASLNDVPHYSPITEADGTVLDIYITGGRLLSGLYSALYQANFLPLLPRVITDTAAGNTALLDAFVPQIALPGGTDRGLLYSVICTEKIPFVDDEAIEQARRELDPELGAVILDFYVITYSGGCDNWAVTPRPPIAVQPVKSDIPTLILSGEFDPVTPPTNGEKAHENLSNSQYFLFRGLSHGVLRSDKANGTELSCAASITLNFLNDPSTAVDGSCASKLPGPFD